MLWSYATRRERYKQTQQPADHRLRGHHREKADAADRVTRGQKLRVGRRMKVERARNGARNPRFQYLNSGSIDKR